MWRRLVEAACGGVAWRRDVSSWLLMDVAWGVKAKTCEEVEWEIDVVRDRCGGGSMWWWIEAWKGR
jgi:hypothetical protein